MNFTVDAQQIGEAESFFRRMAEKFPDVVEKELEEFGRKIVIRLKEGILSNEFNNPFKKDGSVPLYRTGRYVAGWTPRVIRGKSLVVEALGENQNMSNDALSELLEYGAPGMPAKPHLRPWSVWVNSQLPLLARNIADGLFSRG